MGQELWLDRQSGVFPLSDRFAEMGGIPVNDYGGEQVEPGHAIAQSLGVEFLELVTWSSRGDRGRFLQSLQHHQQRRVPS